MIQLELRVTEICEISPGVFQTFLKHPQLDGVLSFTHSKGQDEKMLSQLDCSNKRKQKEVPILLKGVTKHEVSPPKAPSTT